MATSVKKLFLGDLAEMRRDVLHFFLTSKQRGEIAAVRFGPRRLYILHHPDHIREVLVHQAHAFHKGRGLQKAKPVVGEGLLTSEGETHRRQRRLMQPHFNAAKIGRYAEQMLHDTETLLQKWEVGEERWISSDMMDLTLNVICHTMFGTDIGEQTARIREAVEVVLERVIENTRSAVALPLFLPTRQNRRFRQALQVLDDIILSIIEQRRQEAGKKGEDRREPSADRRDLLSILLAARDEETGRGLSDLELKDQVMTIFLAGHETTAHTLSWTWYLLSRHPEAERKFHRELDEVLQGRRPTVDDLKRLPYTTQILQESMRLYPAAWAIPRKAVAEATIGGVTFKPGDLLVVSQYCVHRNPDYFERPDEFIPERFTDELLRNLPPFAYFPFGGGPRVCIGNQFAMLEATLILAVIGQRYRLPLSENCPPVVPDPSITLRPKNGIRVKVEKRV